MGRCHRNHFWLYIRCKLAQPGEYDGTVHGLMSNYFDHLSYLGLRLPICQTLVNVYEIYIFLLGTYIGRFG